MKSLAIYYKNVNQETQTPEIGLHINLWKVEEGSWWHLHPSFYIDLGIMVPFCIEELKLYFPFRCEMEDNFDLGELLESRTLISTVFNDDYSPFHIEQNHCYHEIKKNNETHFYLYKLGANNLTHKDYQEEGKNGSLIEIKNFSNIENAKDNKPRYIRFRLKITNVQEVVRSEHISNDLLQAAFSKIDLFDIRINELREIHDKVHESALIENFALCKFSKIHVFYMADTKENIENGSSLKVDSRMLEDSQWATYEPKSNLKGTTYIAHHWKQSMKDNTLIDSFSLFFSSVYPSIDVWRLVAYFITVLFTSSLASLLMSDLDKMFDTENHNCTYKKLIALMAMLVYIIIYLIVTNFKFTKCKIERKR